MIKHLGLSKLIASALFVIISISANVQAEKKLFDHSNTGFELEGAHSSTACENCHIGGQFDGTPRMCESCHSLNGRFNATVKPPNHISVSQQCDSCHQPVAWSSVVLVDHTQVLGACFQCHNNMTTYGKPSNHIQTLNQCGDCHTNTLSWTPVFSVDHELVLGTCVSCHNNVVVSGQPSNHMATLNQCDACHTNTKSWAPVSRVDHDFVIGGCSSCHNGVTARGQKIGHVPTLPGQECNACHNTERFSF